MKSYDPRHFFVGEFLVTALQSEKRVCLEKRRRTAYSGCPKFFSSYIKSSGIIDELSFKNKSSWIILSAKKMEDEFYGI